MTYDADHINAEIDRLAVETTDPAPMQLFLERAQLQKRLKLWKYASCGFGLLAGAVGFYVFVEYYSQYEYGFLEAVGLGLAGQFLVAVIGRKDVESRVNGWFERASLMVGG